MAERHGGGRRARPGGHELSPEALARFQRRRILDGAAKVIAERGYRQVTVADIVKSAAIARARFYENFSSKEDCFFALYDAGTEAARRAVADACSSIEGGLALRVRKGIEALLSYLESDPALGRACVLEGPAVGPAIGPHFEQMISDFAELLRAARAEGGDGQELAGTVEETVVGGLYWLLYYAYLEAGEDGLPDDLLAQLTEFSLIPFVGVEAAHAAAS